VFGVVLHATPLGRAIFAIGANQEAAFYSGIRVRRIKFWLFVLSGLMCGFAGVLWTLRFASARYDSGIGLELFVVTVVLLGGVSIFGGRGTILGVALAVAVLGCLQTAMTADLIPAQDQNIVVGALLLASVIVPNAGEIYQRARTRLHSVLARRHAAVQAREEG
jgi:rhamnose transport system permease protein